MVMFPTFSALPAKIMYPVLIKTKFTYCKAYVSAYIFLPTMIKAVEEAMSKISCKISNSNINYELRNSSTRACIKLSGLYAS